ncbi:hypothetical protein J3Q64DRAFT_1757405 [Phycomyces blakesleeanus]|uniref:Uncharacterized protein n=1 Tax=Phycomyces blakesleeanus TaxID=4837 RepID=A0ABR3AUW4_PHYBL
MKRRKQIGAQLQIDGYITAAHFSLQAASELRRTPSFDNLPLKAKKYVKTSHGLQEELFSANSPEHLDDLAVSSSQQHESQPNSFTDTSTDSYIDEGDISDDSQSVEAGDVFDFLSTTEGVYDVSVPSITKSWKVVSGFNVSESFLQYRETCIEKAKTHRNLETHEELALSGIMLIDDSICEEHYFPFEHVEDVLQDIEAVDYFHIPNADEEESRLCQKFAYNMQQRRLNYDHVDRILDDM